MDSRAAGVPATCGVNVTVNVALWREASVIGNVRPLTTNWGSEDVTLEIVTDLRELLVMTSVICFEVPMTAVPKSRLVLLTTRPPSLTLEDLGSAAKTAWHPAIRARINRMQKTPAKRSQRELRSIFSPSKP